MSSGRRGTRMRLPPFCRRAAALLLLAPLTCLTMATPTDDDLHLWLEDVHGEQALAWVRERNAATRKQLEAWPRWDSGTRSGIRPCSAPCETFPANWISRMAINSEA